MALTTVSVLAATAILGVDLLRNRPDVQSAGRPRVIRSLALTGSAAVGDTQVDIKVGDRVIATLYNSSLGFATADADQFKTQYRVNAGSPISAVVTDAPATNPINLQIDV